MNNSVSISFTQNRVAQASTALIATVNQQIGQAAQLDDQAGLDQAVGLGSVMAQDQDSFVQLSYKPQTGEADSFSFKAHNDIKAPSGEVVIPKGVETSFTKDTEGAETYQQDLPTQDGSVFRQQAVVDPKTETITYNEWILKA